MHFVRFSLSSLKLKDCFLIEQCNDVKAFCEMLIFLSFFNECKMIHENVVGKVIE